MSFFNKFHLALKFLLRLQNKTNFKSAEMKLDDSKCANKMK